METKIHKFGGGLSVNNFDIFFPQLLSLLKTYVPQIVVLSAFGKTTNALKDLVDGVFEEDKNIIINALNNIYNFNAPALKFISSKSSAVKKFKEHMIFLEKFSQGKKFCNQKELIVDQILPIGEFIASSIVSSFLTEKKITNHLIDATEFISTDMNFGSANVFKADSIRKIKYSFFKDLENKTMILTQGFIGITEKEEKNFYFCGLTTLGREGSDFSAALIANMLNQLDYEVEEVCLWKDVDGIGNRDPRINSSVPITFFNEIPYEHLLGMINHGGVAEGLIHPKVVEELKETSIPLIVRNFWNPEKKTVVS